MCAASCSASTRNTPRTALSTKEIVERNKPAIVRIESVVATPTGERRQFGTGFVVTADGHIATNMHVIFGSGDVKVRLASGKVFPARRVLAADPQRDLAIISIDAQDLPTVRLGDSDAVSAGDRVVAIGNPLGVLDYTVSDGLISSVRQPEGIGVKLLQISAPISQGSSGGPLFNLYGEVIGVATLISSEGQNLNFGMPSNYLQPLLADKSQGVTMAAFAARFRPAIESGSDGERLVRAPERRVPNHPLSVLDGCSADQLAEVFKSISEAINIGAPVYNRREYEACFVIYRKVGEKFEGNRAFCKGVRDAFGQGLLRAETLDSFSDKAWAMRDAFDGLIAVIERKVNAARP